MATKTERCLKGTLIGPSSGGSFGSLGNYRIYPYQLGCQVLVNSTGASVSVSGTGDFIANDYLMVCTQQFYGGSYFYVPDTTRVAQVQSVTPGATGTLTLTGNLVVEVGEWLLNLGADTGGVAPNYDGSRHVLYTDPGGNTAVNGHYVSTASQGGVFICWLGDSPSNASNGVVDILACEQGGTPKLVIPCETTGDRINT